MSVTSDVLELFMTYVRVNLLVVDLLISKNPPKLFIECDVSTSRDHA